MKQTKHIRSLLIVVLVLILIFALAACNGNNQSNTKPDNSSNTNSNTKPDGGNTPSTGGDNEPEIGDQEPTEWDGNFWKYITHEEFEKYINYICDSSASSKLVTIRHNLVSNEEFTVSLLGRMELPDVPSEIPHDWPYEMYISYFLSESEANEFAETYAEEYYTAVVYVEDNKVFYEGNNNHMGLMIGDHDKAVSIYKDVYHNTVLNAEPANVAEAEREHLDATLNAIGTTVYSSMSIDLESNDRHLSWRSIWVAKGSNCRQQMGYEYNADEEVIDKYEGIKSQIGSWYTSDSYVNIEKTDGSIYYRHKELPRGLVFSPIHTGDDESTEGATVKYYSYDDGKGLNVVIPSVTPDGKTVVSISDKAFIECPDVTSITIPDTVKTIGQEAFSGCIDLETITIGEGVQSIEENAFLGCENLKKVIVSSLGNWCSIEFENEVDIYGNYSCYSNPLYAANYDENSNCKLIYNETELTGEVTIPSEVTKINAWTFYGQSGMTSVVLSDTMKAIDASAFAGCTGLQKVNYEGDFADWLAIDFCESGFVKEWDDPVAPPALVAFRNKLYIDGNKVPFNGNLQIPQGVTYIGDYALCGLEDGEVTIPDSVTNMGFGTFYCSTGLKKVNYEGTLAQWIAIDFGGYQEASDLVQWVTDNCDSIDADDSTMVLRDILYIDGQKVVFDENFRIPSDVTKIGDYAFFGLNLKEISIPSSVKTIGAFAFAGSELTSVTIPGTVEKVCQNAFLSCLNLETLTIEGGVKQICIGAFAYDYKLKTVVISDNIESLDVLLFFYCDSLQSVFFEGTEERWKELDPMNGVIMGGSGLSRHKLYYFSEDPIYDGAHWHWSEQDHTPEVWQEA